MVLRGSTDLRSYDRVLSNQDVLPEGGFATSSTRPCGVGARENGLTVFLDPRTVRGPVGISIDPQLASPGDLGEGAHSVLKILDSARVGAPSTNHRKRCRGVCPQRTVVGPLPDVDSGRNGGERTREETMGRRLAWVLLAAGLVVVAAGATAAPGSAQAGGAELA